MTQTMLAAVIFVLTYLLIVTERVHRTLAALVGGLAIIVAGVLNQQEAFQAVDWNVIFLLVGMMVIANTLRETGLFQWIAVQAIRVSRGDPRRILVILALVTAASSALLDNVTSIVLVIPITLLVTLALEVKPMPFLIAEILACNIGGMSTLIGDPPNVLIGSAAGIDFLTFAANMAPISLVILLLTIGLILWMFRKDLRVRKAGVAAIEAMDTHGLITDRRLLRRSLVVMAGILTGFLVHGLLHLQPATIALGGATVLMAWGRVSPQRVFQEVEWTTLLFFVGLFILVEAVVRVGIVQAVALAVVQVTHNDLTLTSLLLLWVSAILSGIVDNIPYTTAVIPIVETLGQAMRIGPLWWALALGACLGGNATLIGASANVVVACLAERSGHPIRFLDFLKYGLPVTLLSLLVSTAYIWLFYLR